ncbi:LacI family DNA-binding transcriptional regulator [Mycobacterium sp. 236(2023)]|uniref:LacI family DNA-binding transcriptional regulator n=1 Tax=Mycobacterium sp. 236(2023) TaxID=3038163 RepID=UPI0024150092|nr:LacI family DNA-binding transcriptional regulator [Mycobacterium sp. 236(2023)]MDG4663149.1 LacI family DNA-binding transcriptional regulator [Mycobacterium sp. 236(2023)]
MQDVADKVGVSKALVSVVFRNAPGASAETRQRVLDAADEIGYRVNRNAALMTAKRSHLIGVMAKIGSGFHAEIVEDLVAAADRAGYEIVLGAVTPTHDESRVIETLRDFRCEGLLLIGPELPARELARLGTALPTVVIGRRITESSLDVVRSADGRGIGSVVDHLVSLGHHDIVHVDGGSGTISADRRSGFLRAMRRHDLEREARIIAGDFTEIGGMRSATELLDTTLPTAIVCSNDYSAIGVIDRLRRAGVSVPQDVSVSGFDNNVLARLGSVDLTSVSQQPQEQADRAIDAVVQRLDGGRTEPLSTVLAPALVIRGSTGPAPSR